MPVPETYLEASVPERVPAFPAKGRLGLRRLLVVSSATHYLADGQLAAYGPYTREIDIWADLFDEVVIAAPCLHERAPGD